MPLDPELQASWGQVIDETDPLGGLRAARDVRDRLGAWEAHLARLALAAGETWETIGDALGTSRQAAWQRLRPAIVEEIDLEKSRLREKRQRLESQQRLESERRRQWTSPSR